MLTSKLIEVYLYLEEIGVTSDLKDESQSRRVSSSVLGKFLSKGGILFFKKNARPTFVAIINNYTTGKILNR